MKPLITAQVELMRDPEYKQATNGNHYAKALCRVVEGCNDPGQSWVMTVITFNADFAARMSQLRRGHEMIVQGPLETNYYKDTDGYIRMGFRLTLTNAGWPTVQSFSENVPPPGLPPVGTPQPSQPQAIAHQQPAQDPRYSAEAMGEGEAIPF